MFCQVKPRHWFQFEFISRMLPVNKLFYSRIIDLSGSDIPVKHLIRKPEIIFISPAAQPVDRSLLNKHVRQAALASHSLNFLHGKFR